MTSTPRATSDRAQAVAAKAAKGNAAAKRKPAAERRAEIVEAAARIALDEGLHAVTLASVAEALGVYPGLVHHYFRTVDALVSAGFGHGAEQERAELFHQAEQAPDGPLEELRVLLAALVDEARDAVSLLWLDAWQAGRHRPQLREEVARQMIAWQERLAVLIAGGVEAGAFVCADPATAALRVLAMIDGLNVQAALRNSTIDYTSVRDLVLDTTERELGLRAGRLRLDQPIR